MRRDIEGGLRVGGRAGLFVLHAFECRLLMNRDASVESIRIEHRYQNNFAWYFVLRSTGVSCTAASREFDVTENSAALLLYDCELYHTRKDN